MEEKTEKPVAELSGDPVGQLLTHVEADNVQGELVFLEVGFQLDLPESSEEIFGTDDDHIAGEELVEECLQLLVLLLAEHPALSAKGFYQFYLFFDVWHRGALVERIHR